MKISIFLQKLVCRSSAKYRHFSRSLTELHFLLFNLFFTSSITLPHAALDTVSTKIFPYFLHLQFSNKIFRYSCRRSAWCRNASGRTTSTVSPPPALFFCSARGAGPARRASTFRQTSSSTTSSWPPFCSTASSSPWRKLSKKQSKYHTIIILQVWTYLKTVLPK